MEFKELLRTIINYYDLEPDKCQWKIIKAQPASNFYGLKLLRTINEEFGTTAEEEVLLLRDGKVEYLLLQGVYVCEMNLVETMQYLCLAGAEIEDFKEAKKEFKNWKSCDEI